MHRESTKLPAFPSQPAKPGTKRAIIPDMNTSSERTGSMVSIRRLTIDDARAAAELSSQLGYLCSTGDLRERIDYMSRGALRIAISAITESLIFRWIESRTLLR